MIDTSVLDNLLSDMGGDADTVRELVQSFLTEGPTLLSEGRRAALAADATTCQRAYHTLKGNAATFGAMELSLAAKAIEQGSKTGTMPTTAEMDTCDHLFAAARAELQRRFGA